MKNSVYLYLDDRDNDEYCKHCDDNHNPLVGCSKEYWIKELKPIVEKVNREFKEKQYWCELERFRRLFE